MKTQPDMTLQSADLEINTSTQQVTKQQVPLKLPHLSYLTLTTLMKHAPNIVSIDQLIDEVWQDIAVSPETVTQRIALLRRSLGQTKEVTDQYIASIRNKGYRWVPEVAKHPIPHTLHKKNFKINSTSMVILTMIILTAGVILFSINDHKKTEKTGPPNLVSKNITGNDLTKQAWRYLDKHDFKSNQLAVGLFERSLEDNPTDVNTLTGLSMALSHQVTKFNQAHHLLKKAKNLAEQAITLDPDHAQSWAALAFMHDARGEIDKAIELYKKSLSFDPNNSSTISSLAYLYSQKGLLIDALRLNLSVLGNHQQYLDLQIAQTLELLNFDSLAEQWYERAEELSPDNVFATHLRSQFYLCRNQQHEAQNLIHAAINRGVNRPELHILLGIIDLMNQQKKSAQSHFLEAIQIDSSDTQAQLWHFVTKPYEQLTTEYIKEFKSTFISGDVSWPDQWVSHAIFYAHIGNKQQALSSLNQAYQAGYLNALWLEKLPILQKIRHEPEFLLLLENIKNDVNKQRQQLLNAEWLPTSFLDPKI